MFLQGSHPIVVGPLIGPPIGRKHLSDPKQTTAPICQINLNTALKRSRTCSTVSKALSLGQAQGWSVTLLCFFFWDPCNVTQLHINKLLLFLFWANIGIYNVKNRFHDAKVEFPSPLPKINHIQWDTTTQLVP